ncbi:MAG TPA: thiamine phosphate synthase [Pyrinomonadaceae bacterium]
MTFRLPRIYPITDITVSGLSHAEQVSRLIDGGAALIQLRDKHSWPKDFLREAEAALEIARRNNVRVIINDRVDIALALDADGVHLGQSDMPVDAARALLGSESIIGFSAHNIAQVERASALPVNYIAFGPIFDTHTKSDHEPVVGLPQLSVAKQILTETPLVAIGGIAGDNFLETLRAGADSVAIISHLLSEPAKIAQKLKQMRARLRG